MLAGRILILTLLCGSTAVAQPIIIPLEPQHKPEPPPPVASAPPVAPPVADPAEAARTESAQPTTAVETAQPPAR